MKNIQLFAPTFDVDACLAEIRICLERGWTGIGFKTVEFEEKFGKYLGAPYCHFVNSNTNGMHLLLETLKRIRKWQDGDEVISTALTFVSTNHSILHANLKVVFADVDESLCVNAAAIKSRISAKTRAVVFVGIGGNSGEIEAIAKLCRERGLVLILDAAHAAGSRLNGAHLSSYAEYSVFSFQAVKNLPTGDSGLVVFATAEEDALARQLSWCGINKDTYSRSKDGYKWLYSVDEVGFKYNGNSIMAGIAIAQLAVLDAGNARRREIAAVYRDALSDLPQMRLIPHANECESSRHLVQFYCERRNDLINFLADRGVGSGVHYLSNSRYPMYADQVTPRADALDQEIITLPIHLRLTDDDLGYVANEVTRFYRG
jgi:dTDP-4-amino-4,6-dideoxygalactose transaminase